MDELEVELKKLIVEVLLLKDLRPEDIDSQTPLLVDGLGFDSIDALELALAIGKRYGVKFRTDEAQNRAAFSSVHALAAFVRENRPAVQAPAAAGVAAK
ncbi:MAG: phosphopantetheine-binding protein [Myxococcales bacterium]